MEKPIYNSRNSKDLIVAEAMHAALTIYNSRNSKDLIVKTESGESIITIYNSRNSKDLIVDYLCSVGTAHLQQ